MNERIKSKRKNKYIKQSSKIGKTFTDVSSLPFPRSSFAIVIPQGTETFRDI